MRKIISLELILLLADSAYSESLPQDTIIHIHRLEINCHGYADCIGVHKQFGNGGVFVNGNENKTLDFSFGS